MGGTVAAAAPAPAREAADAQHVEKGGGGGAAGPAPDASPAASSQQPGDETRHKAKRVKVEAPGPGTQSICRSIRIGFDLEPEKYVKGMRQGFLFSLWRPEGVEWIGKDI